MLLEALLRGSSASADDSSASSTLASMLPDKEAAEKVRRYQEFSEKKLQPQLAEYQKARDEVYKELGQYLLLKSTIEMTKEQKLKKLEMKFDVGHEFYMQAEALDLNRICVKVSREFYVELNQEEALNFIEKKERVMNGQIENLSEKMAEVRAHVVFVNEAIRELLNISE